MGKRKNITYNQILKAAQIFIEHLEINHILIFALLFSTCPLWRTLAVVGVDTIHTSASIHAHVVWTVIYVNFTVVSFKT